MLRSVVSLVGPPLEHIRQVMGLIQTNDELSRASEALRRTQADLVSAERMTALGQMATGVAHEINNPLAYVKSNVEVMRHYVDAFADLIRLHAQGHHEDARHLAVDLHQQDLAAELQDLVAETLEGATRAYRVVRDLKAFGPQLTSNWVKLNPGELVESTLHLLHGDLKTRATITANVLETPLVFGDTGRLRQALQCLLLNAAQAIPSNREGQVEVRCRPERGGVCIEVKDNGEGIPDALRERIFEPFFTTREGLVGSGLGLSIVRDVVHAHRGRVEVQSIPGEGSVFTLWLPEAKLQLTADRRTVLFIDEEQVWLNAYHRACTPMARPILANGAVAGLKALAQEPQITAVVCDLQLPAHGSEMVYRWLAEYRPELCDAFVAATSGPHDDGVRRFLDTTDVPVLYKSFGMSDLSGALESIFRGQ